MNTTNALRDLFKSKTDFEAIAKSRPTTTAKIRYDWLSTPEGYKGGLNRVGFSKNSGQKYPLFGQRTEFSELLTGAWEEIKVKARKEAEIHFKPIHKYDGEYVAGIVLIEWLDYGQAYRTTCFKNPYAEEFGCMDIAERIASNMGYVV